MFELESGKGYRKMQTVKTKYIGILCINVHKYNGWHELRGAVSLVEMLVDGDKIGHHALRIWDSDAEEVICIKHFRNACFPGECE